MAESFYELSGGKRDTGFHKMMMTKKGGCMECVEYRGGKRKNFFGQIGNFVKNIFSSSKGHKTKEAQLHARIAREAYNPPGERMR